MIVSRMPPVEEEDYMLNLRLYFVFAFVFGFVLLHSNNARSSGDIEFHATNNTQNEWCMQCTGPFSRFSPKVPVMPGGTIIFYSAQIGEFSPYGNWNCSLYTTDTCFLLDSQPEITTGISVPAGIPLVDLVILEQQGFPTIVQRFTALGAEGDGDLSVVSKLGNDPVPGVADRDTFRFRGQEGDQVTIRLEGDPTAGHIGSHTRLRLNNGRKLSEFLKVRTGELPLEITVTIPETGTYEVTAAKVAQSDVPDNLLSFRGGYILSVDSADNEIEALIPGENVEQ